MILEERSSSTESSSGGRIYIVPGGERERETVLVISFSLVVAGLRVYRIHGFDHSLANLP